MSSETKSKHLSSIRSMLTDVGFEAQTPAVLKMQSQRIVTQKQAIKTSLISELAGWIKAVNLTPAEAAVKLGVTRACVSDVANKRTDKFTIDALVNMLARAGKRFQVTVENK